MTESAKRKARKTKAGSSLRQTYEDAAPIDKPAEPKERRYITNDTSYEKLGVMLADNPIGMMAHRDEMISILRHLDHEDQVNAKSFFMTAWNGNDSYKFDRIGRGATHVENACLSLLGATTTSALSEYVYAVRKAGTGGEGLIQRFGLIAWPDIKPDWHNVDEYPDREARDDAWDTFERLDTLTPECVKAGMDRFDDSPFLRFDPNAQAVFNNWQEDLQRGLWTGDLAPELASHFAKYGKLVPALALINHLSDPKDAGPVSEAAIRKAIRFARYLATHARRVYGSAASAETSAAKAILAHIRKGDLKDRFTAREVHRPDGRVLPISKM